jgi:DNA-directed RNA polymerase sigma subunit (sigma70/sigma32)
MLRMNRELVQEMNREPTLSELAETLDVDLNLPMAKARGF